MGAAIQARTVLGEQCIVGANAVVRGIFPPFSVIAGVPGRIIKRFDSTGKDSKWRRVYDNSICSPPPV